MLEPKEGEATSIGITKIMVNVKLTASFVNGITLTRLC
jgi:hypothetical protein